MQSSELAGQCLQFLLVSRVVDVQARSAQHGDFDSYFTALIRAKLLERFEGIGDVHHHVQPEAATKPSKFSFASAAQSLGPTTLKLPTQNADAMSALIKG